MYSQPHHGLIFQKPAKLLFKCSFTGCEINHVTRGPPWYRGGRRLSYSRNTANELSPSPSLPTPHLPSVVHPTTSHLASLPWASSFMLAARSVILICSVHRNHDC